MKTRFVHAAPFIAVVALTTLLARQAGSQEKGPQKGDEKSKTASGGSRVSVNDPKALQGYTLIAPLNSTKTQLVDMQGRPVRTWPSDCQPGLCAYLLENGHLLRPGKVRSEELDFDGAGTNGRIQEFTWEGELVWDFKFHNKTQLPHHDICKMPNGNVLMLVWNKKSAKEAIDAGRKASEARGASLYDSIIEVKPTGKTTGEVVWQWHVWDHLIQDIDKSKANFGAVAAHPELIDVNFGRGDSLFGGFGFFGAPDKSDPKKDVAKKDDLDLLRGIGYIGTGKGKGPLLADWPHFNCVTYNAELDQIMVSSRLMSEFWIIDHGTTTAEAASHKGGKHGRGGDLLYRWGNARAYRAGTAKDQALFHQHNAHWIPKGLPGAGNVIVYNNGDGRPGGSSSSVDEIVLPVDKEGNYALKPGAAYGPDKAVWSYSAPKKSDFYSWIISGAHRLPNGNTLICEGMSGTIFEVTRGKELVWKYRNQSETAPTPFAGPSKPGQVLSPALQDFLKLRDEQKKQVAELQDRINDQLGNVLVGGQKKQFEEIQEGKSVGGGLPPHGQILTAFLVARLKLTAEQRKQVEGLQQEVNTRLTKMLDEEQKHQLKAARISRFANMNPFGQLFGRAVFRSYRYAPDYAGLTGRDLTPAEEPAPKKNTPPGQK